MILGSSLRLVALWEELISCCRNWLVSSQPDSDFENILVMFLKWNQCRFVLQDFLLQVGLLIKLVRP